MSDIAQQVQAIIAKQLKISSAAVTPSSNYFTDLNADSLDTVELIMEFEKEFNVTIPADQLMKMQTVQDTINYIEKQ